MEKLNDLLNRLYDTDEKKAAPSMIALAYLGDTLFDLYVRNYIINYKSVSPHEMHLIASGLVCCASQARMAEMLQERLDEEELSVLKRARNQKSISPPKNASPVDYKWATGLEALLGYLFVNGREERAFEIIKEGLGLLEDRRGN